MLSASSRVQYLASQGGVAQWTERVFPKHKIPGSSPGASTNTCLRELRLFAQASSCEAGKEKEMKKVLISMIKAIGFGLAIIICLIAVWLFIILTPDQVSAEAEIVAEEIEMKK